MTSDLTMIALGANRSAAVPRPLRAGDFPGGAEVAPEGVKSATVLPFGIGIELFPATIPRSPIF